MAEFNVSMRVDATDEGATATFERLVASVNRLNDTLEKQAGTSRRSNTELEKTQSSGRKAAQGTDEAANATRRLEQAAKALLGIGTARYILAQADAYANMTAKIKLAAGGGEQFAAVQQAVFQVAQRTSAALGDTVTLYTRLASATRDAGVGNAQLLQLTERINQAMAVSGATTAEASGAIVQLSQALAAGALRGEEFNSVNEAAPRLMEALAKSLGVTRGALRAMAQEGELSAKRVMDALLGIEGDKIAAEHAQLPLTIGRAWQQLQNAVTSAIGQVDKATGGTAKLAGAIKFAADNLGEIIPLLVTLGEIALVALAAKGAVAALRFAWGVGEAYKNATLAATGMKTLAGQAQLLVAAFAGWQIGKYLRENFLVAQLAGIAFVEGTLVGWERIKQGAQVAFEGIKFLWNAVIGAMQNTFAWFVEGVAAGVDILPDWAGGENAQSLREYAASIRPARTATEEFNASLALINETANENVARIRETTGAMADDAIAANAAREATSELNAALTDSPGKFDEAGKSAEGAAKKVAKWRQEMEDLASAVLVDSTEQQLLRLSMAIEEAQRAGKPGMVDMLTRAWAKLAAELEKTKLEATLTKNSMASLVNPVKELLEGYEREAQLIGMSSEARRRAEATFRAEREARRAIEEAAQRGIIYTREEREQIVQTAQARARMVEEMAEHAAQTERYQSIIAGGFNSIGDAIGDVFRGAIRSASDLWKRMKDIARNMVADLIAEFIKLRIIKPILEGLFSGGGGGGFWGSLLGIAGAALGGGGGGGGATGSLVTAGVQAISGANTGNYPGTGGNSSTGGNYLGTAVRGANYLTGGAIYQAAGNYVMNTPWLANGLGPAMAYGGAATGAYYGLTNRGRSTGDVGSLAAGVSYGALGYVGGTVAAGAILGGAGSAAAGAGVAAGAGAGAMGAAAAIPIVGWIIAALAFIDLASGGRLFGTRFQADDISQTVGINQEGGVATASVREVRQRALFRGREWRTEEIDPSDEAVREAQRLFMRVDRAMQQAARGLGVEVERYIEGVFTVTQDINKGKPKGDPKEFFEILGQRFDEGYEEFVKRLTGYNLLSVIATALTPDQIGAGRWTPDGDGDPTGGGGGRDPGGINQMLKEVSAGIDENGGNVRDALEETAHSWDESFSALMAIAQRWEGTADEFLGGVQFLLAAATDMVNGIGLLGEDGTLEAITDLVEQFQLDGEALVQTYARVQTSVMMLEEALGLAGASSDLAREQFVHLAVGVTEALGGLENATALWNRFFTGFYESSVLLERQIEQMTGKVETQLGALGFDSIPSLEEFERRFTEALPTMSSDEIAQWLLAGDALLTLNETIAQLGEEAARAQAEADRAATEGMPEFYVSLYNITTAANRAADAARRQGASETALALIHINAARQVGQAIAMLRARTQDLISQLYGGMPGTLDEINRRIQEIEGTVGSSGTIGAGISDVDDALGDLFATWERGLQAIRGWLDDILLNDQLTTLNPQQQLEEAGNQFYEALALAQGGDADAMAMLPQLANQYLGLARGFFSSGDDYTAIFQAVMAAMSGMGGMENPFPQPGGNDTGGGGTFVVEPSEQLIALYAARDEALNVQTAAHRAQLALDLAQHLNMLAQAINTPVLELAGLMGVSLEQLATDMGVNLDELTGQSVLALTTMASVLGVTLTELTGALGLELTDLAGGVTELTNQLGIDLSNLTAESTQALGALAASMGIDLRELATTLGLDLGSLADSQSLLNQALEAEIASLPAAQRDQLQPLLDAIASATTEADANAAIGLLEDAVGELSPDLQDRLAPYLEGIVPTSQSADVRELITANSWLASMDDHLYNAVQELRSIAQGGGETANAIPPFDGGAQLVTGTGLAVVHSGEGIMDPTAWGYLRDYGIQVWSGGSDGALDEIIANQLAGLRQDTRAGNQALVEQVEALKDRVAELEATASDIRDLKQQQADRERTGS